MNTTMNKRMVTRAPTLLARTAGLVPWMLLTAAVWMVAANAQNPRYLWTVFSPWAEVGCLAVVMTPIILTGGIDLSVGSIVALSGMVLGVLWHDAEWPIWMATLAAVFTGTLAGSLNGWLVVIGMPPLVATLATMAFFRGLAMAISNAQQVDRFPETFTDLTRIQGIPIQFWLLLVTVITCFVVVHFSRFGRSCFAIGDNRTATRFAAVPVARVEWLLYSVSGLMCALVAISNAIKQDVVLPDAQMGVELSAIACVVIGGTLITGGRGGVLRTVLGLAVVSNLDVGLNFLSSRISWLTGESRLIVIGVLLMVVAVLNEKATRDKDRSALLTSGRGQNG